MYRDVWSREHLDCFGVGMVWNIEVTKWRGINIMIKYGPEHMIRSNYLSVFGS